MTCTIPSHAYNYTQPLSISMIHRNSIHGPHNCKTSKKLRDIFLRNLKKNVRENYRYNIYNDKWETCTVHDRIETRYPGSGYARLLKNPLTGGFLDKYIDFINYYSDTNSKICSIPQHIIDKIEEEDRKQQFINIISQVNTFQKIENDKVKLFKRQLNKEIKLVKSICREVYDKTLCEKYFKSPHSFPIFSCECDYHKRYSVIENSFYVGKLEFMIYS